MSESDDSNNIPTMSLDDRLDAARAMVESSPKECIPLLHSIQRDIRALALFSKNETIDDISTRSIPFLSVDHFLAVALGNLPIEPGAMVRRKENIQQSLTLWEHFLERLETLEILSKEETNEFHHLLEAHQEASSTFGVHGSNFAREPLVDRDAKIARYKAKQQQRQEIEKLKALIGRRNRCKIDPEDEVDGHDLGSLERTLILKELQIFKIEALENWSQSVRELPMIERMIKIDSERQQKQIYTADGHNTNNPDSRPSRPSNKGLQVTHITQHAETGQLLFKRDEIRSKVFQPGWSQPTVSLEEFGEREYHQAIEREERQKKAEQKRIYEPKRYEELVKDGMEDNAELVEASAKLDRDWDDWKDQNPRGSGNKMANRGDKNF